MVEVAALPPPTKRLDAMPIAASSPPFEQARRAPMRGNTGQVVPYGWPRSGSNRRLPDETCLFSENESRRP